MSDKQNVIDIYNIMCVLNKDEISTIKELAEKLIDIKLLLLAPDVILENMDITEKLMLLDELSLTDEERKKEKEEAIPFEQILKEKGISIDELQN